MINKTFKVPKYNLRGVGLEIDEVIELINPKTEIIGISSMFSHEWLYTRDCINLIKEKFPNAIIIAGGEHVTALPEYCLRDCNSIDYIALGEGEETWSEILNSDFDKFDDIKGLAYLKKHGITDQYIQTEPRTRIKQIDEVKR